MTYHLSLLTLFIMDIKRLITLGIAATAVLTAAIHIYFLDWLLVLNGLGYLGLLALFLLPQLRPYREPIRWLLIGYTVLTIVLYFVTHPDGHWRSKIGLGTKLVEAVLVLLLLADWQLKTKFLASKN